MTEYDEYKYILGETIILYQQMENDLKLIYAGMLDGQYYKNIEHVRSTFKGLGQIIVALEQLDNSDSTPYFSKETYALLNKLARQRNFYCHQCCIDFCYNPDFENSIEFKEGLTRLRRTNEIIKFVQTQTNEHRDRILAKYGRN